MIDHLERQTATLAALLVAGEFHAAEVAVDSVRELAWRRRAAVVRARRHVGPGVRGAGHGRAVLRRKPRAHAITAGEASDLIWGDLATAPGLSLTFGESGSTEARRCP